MTDYEKIAKHLAEKSLKRFIKEAWHVVEPHIPFVDGWHIDAVALHLEAVTSGDIRRLIINIPPGHMKSSMTNVFWPAWEWATHPEYRYIFASYSSELSTRDSLRMRRLIESPWYVQRWGDKFQLLGDQNAKQRYENNQSGFRVASSTGGMGTGERVHRAVSDDLIRANDAHSEASRNTAIEHMRAMSTRGVNPETFAQVLIMQRLHENDPTGWLLEQGGWEHLYMPAEYEPHRKCVTSIWEDPRTEEGQYLWPQQFGKAQIDEITKALGSYGAAGQLQQRPAPQEGGIFKRTWWKFYKAQPVFRTIVQSWDTAFKTGRNNDNSVCTTWGVLDNGYYLLDCWAGKLEFPELKRQAIMLAQKWKPTTILMEDAASGQSLLQELQRDSALPLKPISPDRDKVARAYAVTPLIEAGRVHLPEDAEWLADFFNELSTFPNAAHDDRVDSVTQALNHLLHQGNTGLLDFYARKAAELKNN